MSTPGVQTHMLRLSRDSFYTAVPWDSIALNRFDLLHEALASHRIGSMKDGAELPLRDHPVLGQIDATPIGTNGIRDLNHSLTSHPTYTRPVFVEAILRTAEIVRKHFPKTYCFVALFDIRDDIASPVLTDVLRDSLLRRINTVPGRPMHGFFRETWRSTDQRQTRAIPYLLRAIPLLPCIRCCRAGVSLSSMHRKLTLARQIPQAPMSRC